GRNRTLRQEAVRIGQDPFLAFPETDLSEIGERGGRPEIRNRIIGFFGPHGALPLNTTEEVGRWVDRGDRGFVRFTDIFATRFQQLFFRVWSDARAITQFDHERDDRFSDYINALIGMGTAAFQARDALPDINKTALAPLALGRVKSARRLRQMLQLDLGARIEVTEHVLNWMELEPDATSRLGQRGCTLGQNSYLGARVATVNEKLAMTIRARDLDEYRAYLPGGRRHNRLRDIVRWYLGKSFDVDVSLSLPAEQMPGADLGQTVELGWLGRLKPRETQPDEIVDGARYALIAAGIG
ncbi:MAG: type VI secretion system baseplate subunit TssG, partial [Paracoccus sp. (in: a-proteobacteria)]